MMEKFTIQKVKKSDVDKIVEFKNLHFHGQDPIEMAMPGVKFQTDNADLIVKAIETGFALKLVEKETGTLVGFMIGLPSDGTPRVEHFKKAAENAGDTNTAHVLNLIGSVQKKADIKGKYPKEMKKVIVRMLSVHPHYRGQKLGQKLAAAGIEEARKLGFDMITGTCSSVFSSKIAANLGMQHISTLTYDEFHESIGRKVFNVVEPHSELKTYVLKL